jgi:hypothetical protein
MRWTSTSRQYHPPVQSQYGSWLDMGRNMGRAVSRRGAAGTGQEQAYIVIHVEVGGERVAASGNRAIVGNNHIGDRVGRSARMQESWLVCTSRCGMAQAQPLSSPARTDKTTSAQQEELAKPQRAQATGCRKRGTEKRVKEEREEAGEWEAAASGDGTGPPSRARGGGGGIPENWAWSARPRTGQANLRLPAP